MGFWAALGFLTIFPSPVKRLLEPEEVGRSLYFFPVVGLLLGVLLLGFDILLSRVLPPFPTNVLLVALLVVVTGAMHVDGFIDTCDGAVSGKTAQQRLDIMADSRVGAFGVIGGCLLLLLKFAALASLPAATRHIALVLAPVLGRSSMVLAIFAFPYSRGLSGKGYAFKQGATRKRVATATIFCLAATLVAGRWWHGPVVMFAVFAIALIMGSYMKSRLNGLTGDSYGAINEVAETAALLSVPVVWMLL